MQEISDYVDTNITWMKSGLRCMSDGLCFYTQMQIV